MGKYIKIVVVALISCLGLLSNAHATSNKPEGVVKTIRLNTPGTLLSVIPPNELEQIESLIITGYMNKADADVLTELGTNISYLNLSDCHIINSEEVDQGQECEIPQGFMRNRPKLKEIVFPKNLRSIGFFALQNCTSLEEIILPKTLKFIYEGLYAGEDATPFSGCSRLRKLIFCGSVLNYNTMLSDDLAKSLREIRFPATKGRGPGYHGIGNQRLAGVPATISNAIVYIPSPMSGFLGEFDNCEIYFESTTVPADSRIRLRNCIIHCPKGSTTSYYNAFGKDQRYIESDYPQPTTSSGSQSRNVAQKINLSFALFQKLMSMKPAAVVQYLKQQGCKVEQGGEGVYEAKVKNGGITIYYPSYHAPRRGVGPVEFYTTDRNVCKQWITSLRNADYTYFDNDIWVGDNAHKPEYGVMNNIGNEMEDADYSGTATLFLSVYPM